MAVKLNRSNNEWMNVNWPSNTTGIITIAMRLKLNSVPTGTAVADRFALITRGDSSVVGYYAFMDSNKICVAFENGSYIEPNFAYTPVTTEISIALVWDFTSSTAALKAFVNGSQIGSTFTHSRGTVSDNSSVSTLGSLNGGSLACLDGTISEVGCWNVELTASELAELIITSPERIRPSNLQRYWPFTREMTELKSGYSASSPNNYTIVAHPRIYL